MSSTRNFKSPGIWAADAATTIPSTPIAGQSYRDAATGTANIRTQGKYGLKINSAEWNQIFFLMTSMLSMMDTQGVLGWSDAVDYTGIGVVLGSDGVLYSVSAASGPNNGGAKDPVSTSGYWSSLKPASRYSTGQYVYTDTSAAPAYTVLCDGRTIGDLTSGATGWAGPEAQALFVATWNDHDNTARPIQTSAGVPTTRGASAAVDWAAHKRLPVPTLRDGDALTAKISSALGAVTNGEVIAHVHPGVQQNTDTFGAAAGSYKTQAWNGYQNVNTGSTGGTVNKAGGVFANIWIAL